MLTYPAGEGASSRLSLPLMSSYDNNLSDFHNLVCFSTKFHVPHQKKRKITYISYIHFSDDKYLDDLSKVPFHVSEIFG